MKNKLIPLLLLPFIFQCQHTYADLIDQTIDYLKDPSRKELITGGFYEGHFSDGTPFQMTLTYTTPQSSFGASYKYPQKFTGEIINFEKSSFHNNAFNLSMSDRVAEPPDFKTKILFKEKLTGKLSKDKKSVSGIWAHIEGNKKKTLTFSMHRLITYKGIYVTHKSFYAGEPSDGWINPIRPFKFSAVLPILNYPEINKVNLQNASVCEYDQECSNGTSIEGYYNNLLSLKSENWGYAAGAPHGYDSFIVRNYVTKSETAREVFLDYFFKTSPTCLATLSNLVIRNLKEQQLSGAENFIINKDNYKNLNFLPTPLGLEFLFNQYEVGSYAEGEPNVFINKKQLGDCLIYLPETK